MLQFDSCPNCFALMHGHVSCPKCGYDYNSDTKQPVDVLPPFTVLCERYLVGKVLGKGGFGVTYVALDMESNKLCAIKEYMPAEYAQRNMETKELHPNDDENAQDIFVHGRDKFVEEAKTLLTLKNNPVVVDILDYFTENNTAYLVMEYLDGIDLRRMAKKNGGTIDADFSKEVFLTLANALVDIHKKNILHRDLSPENIYVTKDKKIKLIDFGSARNYVNNQNSGMSILLKPGFAPPEQYNSDGIQGPWTDVYGLCATFYHIVSGKPMLDAMYRARGTKQPTLYELRCDVTKTTSDVIQKGMELDYLLRYKDFSALLKDLDIKLEMFKKPSNEPVLLEQTPRVNPYLAFYVKDKIVKKVTIEPDKDIKIGRSVKSSDVVVDNDSQLSRVHCTVRYDSDTRWFLLKDCSTNGTFLNAEERLPRGVPFSLQSGCSFFLVNVTHKLAVFDTESSE